MSVTRKELEREITGALRRIADFKSWSAHAAINNAVTRIAAGIRLPDGRTSPPLPDLYSTATIATSTTLAYKALDATYQRNLILVSDSNDDRVPPPKGGDYYSFNTFLRKAAYKDLSESGEIYMCCVKGSNLYYQGIPSASVNLLTYFYRKPVDMSGDDSTPDGIPEAFQMDLIKHYTLREFFADYVGEEYAEKTFADKMMAKVKIHEKRFFDAMIDMIDFIGEEGEPIYFATDAEE